jgi:hypothetical protein
MYTGFNWLGTAPIGVVYCENGNNHQVSRKAEIYWTAEILADSQENNGARSYFTRLC